MVAASDILSQLSVEITQEIFMRLSQEDLGKVRKCCKKWRNLVSTEYFTKSKVNFNWINGIFTRSIVSLDRKIKDIIYLDDKILIVVVEVDTILIINRSNRMIEKSLSADGWNIIEKIEDKLYALCYTSIRGQYRVVFKVWNLQSYEEIFNVQTDSIYSFSPSLYKHLIAYTSYENHHDVLYIYNIETGKLDYRKDGIRVAHCSNDIVAMGTSLGIVEIMDLNYNPLMTFNCNNDDKESRAVTRIGIKNEYMVVRLEKSRYEATICVYNLKTKIKVYTSEPSKIALLYFINENIFICSTDENYLALDVRTGKTILEISRGYDYSIMPNNVFLLLTSFETLRMNLWCPRKQKLIKTFDLQKLCPNLHLSSFAPLATNTYFAYSTLVNNFDVQIIHFGPQN